MQVTELTFEQTKTIVYKKEVKTLLNACKDLNIDDFQYIIANLLPHTLVVDKILRSGKNKGKRVVKFRNTELSTSDRNTIVMYFSGMDTVKEFSSVSHFIKNPKGQTMINLVLELNEPRFQYQCHWYTVWVENKHLRSKLHEYLQEELDNDAAANLWFSHNSDKYVPMTGVQYNEYYFANN